MGSEMGRIFLRNEDCCPEFDHLLPKKIRAGYFTENVPINPVSDGLPQVTLERFLPLWQIAILLQNCYDRSGRKREKPK
jgi:hypothetical protein